MIVKVHHQNHDNDMFTHVANVTIPEDINNHKDMLEYAYRWTNNIDGSWSMKKFIDEFHNSDANDLVEVIAPLHIHDGRTYGLRSSSVGDHFIIEDQTYEVARFGFRKV